MRSLVRSTYKSAASFALLLQVSCGSSGVVDPPPGGGILPPTASIAMYPVVTQGNTEILIPTTSQALSCSLVTDVPGVVFTPAGNDSCTSAWSVTVPSGGYLGDFRGTFTAKGASGTADAVTTFTRKVVAAPWVRIISVSTDSVELNTSVQIRIQRSANSICSPAPILTFSQDGYGVARAVAQNLVTSGSCDLSTYYPGSTMPAAGFTAADASFKNTYCVYVQSTEDPRPQAVAYACRDIPLVSPNLNAIDIRLQQPAVICGTGGVTAPAYNLVAAQPVFTTSNGVNYAGTEIKIGVRYGGGIFIGTQNIEFHVGCDKSATPGQYPFSVKNPNPRGSEVTHMYQVVLAP